MKRTLLSRHRHSPTDGALALNLKLHLNVCARYASVLGPSDACTLHVKGGLISVLLDVMRFVSNTLVYINAVNSLAMLAHDYCMLKASAAVMEMRSFGAGQSKKKKKIVFFLQYRTDVVVFLNGSFTLSFDMFNNIFKIVN